MKTRLFAMLLFTAGLALVTAWAVAAREPARESGNMQGASPVLRLNLGAADPTLDPALIWDDRSRFVGDQLFLGLVRADEVTGAPTPELATSWVMSPDATVFTFTLRNGVTWTDGNPLTAYDVRYGILRSLDPATAAEMAYTLFWIQNAEEYNNGTITDTNQVGVTVLDYSHLRFTLKQPAAFFPSTLIWPVARPMPAWAIAAHPTDWTEPAHIVTNGAYRLTTWTHGTLMTMEKNPGYYDAANVQIGQVSFVMVDDATAWTIYQGGQLDSALVPPGEWNAARSDPVLSQQLRAASRFGTYYYGFNTAKAPFDNLLVRKAFIAAVNRQGVVDLVAGRSDASPRSTAHGLPLARTFTAPGIWGHVDGSATGVGIPYAPVQARQWLAAAGYPNGQGLPTITLVYNSDPLHQAVAEHVQQNWTDNLSVTVALSCTSSTGAYFELLKTDPPQVWRLGWIGDYHDAYNFLYEGIDIWHGHWTNPTYDSLLSLAALTADLNTRAWLYEQAEEILVETDAVMAPIYYFANGVAAKPYLVRTYGTGGYGGRIADWRIEWRLWLPLISRNSS
jgi:oligopeptide transport system substrate-binding protein